MFLAFGVVCALFEAQRSGQGQVVDAAMVDGTAILMSMIWGLQRLGALSEELGTNVLDTGAPCYDTYETSDGKFISLGSLEPQFYAELMERTGLGAEDLPAPDGPRRLAGAARAVHRAVQVEDARRSGARSSRAPTCASRRCCR